MIFRSIKIHDGTQMLYVSRQGSSIYMTTAMIREDKGVDEEELLLSLSHVEAKDLFTILKETLE